MINLKGKDYNWRKVMEKLTDNWLENEINENRVFLLGTTSLYHSSFSFFIDVKPPEPWKSDSIWWDIDIDEYKGRMLITKYESAKVSFSGTGMPVWEDRVEISDEELKFWKESKVLRELVDRVINKLEKALNDDRVGYGLSHNHRDFSETREIVKKVMNNVVATKV